MQAHVHIAQVASALLLKPSNSVSTMASAPLSTTAAQLTTLTA
jgi:hypothetical protein